ncbi:hypothetical protein AN0499.2 [Aspergillus nidulans FGSC A4]|uniref:Chitin binding domain protein Peritrophin-A, putative (AFU_orthologue AFUA_7G00670) n=1 Tax=Emericella nidulans (strain FGSC A4 / ATCC 38163 / CBS 112.46 / NRRL 194 / M139) TaxID=227321 RepID=Q5BG31_EMENI|nr:hypothetical protein [Aspergillus nidulans FGSC A4]EAA66598.1 hypothetical protein AN0499.2 [Aspergillus nidulans FGSC A4]CBF89361.1 TPA: chitin binding domain protein Peritrophin-A, putative (AFU_orthologue; AFUA_7G00670) [Aspergillus nidulans FGSC A4]|eukprot:XP_658103.1 hypothetical protein AN0499.2 [Aspergillus nidulans FGSC A4]
MQLTKTLSLLAASLSVLLAPVTAAPAPGTSCHVGASWPDHHDCHKFFECAAGGHPVRKTCGPGTAYSPEIGVCDYEWKVRSCRAHSWTHGAEEGASGSHSGWDKSKNEKGHEGHWSGAGRH